MKRIFTIALLIFAFSLPERSSAWTIGELNDWCQEKEGSELKYLCAGYILGLSQQRKRNCELLGSAFEASQTPLEKFLLEYLTKRAANDLGAAKIPALVKAFTNWADAHPEKWSSPVGAIVTKGDLDNAHFLDAWPCKLDKD